MTVESDIARQSTAAESTRRAAASAAGSAGRAHPAKIISAIKAIRAPRAERRAAFFSYHRRGPTAVMGTFGGLGADRWLQILYSAVKVPVLLAVTFALCLPTYFVLNTLLGLRDDLPEAMRALLVTQIGLAIILATLAPYTAVWYLSSASYPVGQLFNGLMFGVASVSAQLILVRLYRPLIGRHRRHRLVLGFWLVQYVFVGVQMEWVLRPFIGHPLAPTTFFREDGWSNAYVFLAGLIWDLLTGAA